MYQYETSTSKARSNKNTPYKDRYPVTRNPSIRTTKSKISHYKNNTNRKSNIINIYPNNISNISFDYSNNNGYSLINYTNNNLDSIIKEKNNLISNLQNQISEYAQREKESNKKINLKEKIILSLKEQIKQLNNDIVRKRNIIEQNEDIEYKISKLKKEVEKSKDKKLSDEYNE